MKFTDGLKATGNIVQATPQYFFDNLNRIYRFSLDVCALPENAKCGKFYTPEDDGLSQDWKGVCWCNPPYGREIGAWVKKASEEIQKPYCDCIVMLLPARTDARWFQDFVYGKAELHFVRGRLRFGDNEASAPFPSLVAVYTKAI